MSTSRPLKRGTLIRDLSAALNAEIGRVIVGYANLEHLLSSMIHVLIDVSHEEGRLAVRQPRAPDRFVLIRDLLGINNIVPKADLESLQERIANCGRQRDQIAHGVWMLDQETNSRILLRLTKGAWRPVKGQRGNTKRVIHPEGVEYGVEDAHALRTYMDETTDLLVALGTEIEPMLQPSIQKSDKPHQPRNPPHGQKPKGPPDQP